jgi:hypothetical protein
MNIKSYLKQQLEKSPEKMPSFVMLSNTDSAVFGECSVDNSENFAHSAVEE